MSAKRPLTTEDFMNIQMVSDAQFTIDGEGYAFVTTKVSDEDDYESHLYFQHLKDETPTKWTYSGAKDAHPRFSPCGKNLVFQSTRSGRSQIWLMPTDGGEAKQLTYFKKGAMQPEWTKDGKYIIFHAPLEEDDDVCNQSEPTAEEQKKLEQEEQNRPLVIKHLQHKLDNVGFFGNRRQQIILYDIKHGTFIQLTHDFADHHYEDQTEDGQYILFSKDKDVTKPGYIKDLYLLHLPTKEITALTEGEGNFSHARFSPKDEKIAYIGHEFAYKSATLNELYVMDLSTKERTTVSESWDFQIGDVMIGDMRLGHANVGPVWSKDEKYLYFIGTEHGATGLYKTDLEGNKEIVYKKDNHVFTFDYDPNSEKMILGISSPKNPGDFYLLQEDGSVEALTAMNKAFLQEVHLSEPEEIEVTAKDGWKIQGWIMKPYGFEEGKKYPTILEIHGGPAVMYGQSFFHELQLLAAKGYVVLYTNPRGSDGYGQKFLNAVRGDYGGNDYTDLMTAVDTAVEKFSFIDEERLGVTGGSYGGFMTNWIVGHTNRFKAAVTQRSISNWISKFGVSDVDYYGAKWKIGVDLFDGGPEKMWDFSPLKYVENVETPLLILHSENDLRCPMEQAEQLFVALKYLGKEVEFVRFPNASHELSRSGKPSLRVERLNHILRWFDQYL